MKNPVVASKHLYPLDAWCVTEEQFNVTHNYQNETIFALGNGYIGFRGNFEEAYHGPKGSSVSGTYLNGFFEAEPIQYGEKAYGYAENMQTMLNVTNSRIIELEVDGERLNLFAGKLLDYRRELNMRTGILTRQIQWQTSTGKQIEITIERLVSLTHKHLAAINYQFKAINFSGEIRLISAIDAAVKNQECEDDPRVGSALKGQVLKLIDSQQVNNLSMVKQSTTHSGFTLVCGMTNELDSAANYQKSHRKIEQRLEDFFVIEAKQGEVHRLTKWVCYYTTRDFTESELYELAEEELTQARELGFVKLKEEQGSFLATFWQQSDVEVDGDTALQQGIRFNLFQLLQSVGKDGRTSMASKGLTGEGYEGHYFWDTATFVLPMFLYTNPSIAKQLLLYRYNTLDKARQRARQMAHDKGALYPWRTIDGEECSAFFPAGTAQYHINADIIHALKLYIEATDDTEFLINHGAEMAFETARLWSSLGDFIEKQDGKFCINCVTGPDEYTAIVNNNFYTNMMAQMNLQYACDTLAFMKQHHHDAYHNLIKKIDLHPDEPLRWQQAANAMYIPYDEELKVHPQDDTFLQKQVWDFENTPKENYPLLLHYHPLVLYRHQVCKQADVLMADFWLGHKVSLEDKRRDYDYYEPITTHDSSLSPCCYSVLASEVGYLDKAYEYFMETARLDLDDLHGNTCDGIHTANMAGTWMGMTFGFAGMRTYEGELSFNPYLPKAWQHYQLSINFKQRLIKLAVFADRVEFELVSGAALTLKCFNEELTLHPGEAKAIELAKQTLEVIQ